MLGAAVGAALSLVLVFMAGTSARQGVALGAGQGMPRRYVDYLATSVPGSWSDVGRLLPVAVGAGLVAGLLLGLLRWVVSSRGTAEVGRIGTAVVLASSGLVVGVLLAVELHFYGRTENPPAGDFRFTTFEPKGITMELLPTSGPWWPLVLTGAVVGLAVGVLAAVVAEVVGRLRSA